MKLEHIKKTYDGRTVLALETLSLAAGTLYAVVGANGSGKSTLGRIAAGVLAPDRGGRVLAGPGETAAYMPQQSYAFSMSVLKNVLLGAPGNEQSRKRAAALLDRLDMAALARKNARRLSGGETQRMALIRALMTERPFLVLDEPTAALDMRSTLTAETLIKEHRQRTGGTVLLITHSLAQARRLGEQVLFLHEGRLWESGPAKTLLTRPERPETKAFLDFYGL